jgi:hypothetical protein
MFYVFFVRKNIIYQGQAHLTYNKVHHYKPEWLLPPLPFFLSQITIEQCLLRLVRDGVGDDDGAASREVAVAPREVVASREAAPRLGSLTAQNKILP